MRFSQVIVRNVFRRQVRTWLTIGGVAVAMAAVVALVGAAAGLERSWQGSIDSRGADLVVMQAGVAERLGSNLDESLAPVLAKLPHVAYVSPVLVDRIAFEGGSPLGNPIFGVPVGSYALGTYRVSAGRSLEPSDKQGILLGAELAELAHKNVGDELVIWDRPQRVVGIFTSTSKLNNNTAVVLLSTLQEMTTREGHVNQFYIRLADDVPDRAAAVAEVRGLIEPLKRPDGKSYGLTAMPAQDFVRTSTELRVVHAMSYITSLLALILGTVGMLNTMVMSVLERTQEIGILRAIGWRRGRILRMILGESFLLGTAGAVLGCGLGLGLVYLMSLAPAVGGLIEPHVSPTMLAASAALTLAVSLGGGFYPAWRGASLQPTEALRYE